MWRKRWGVGGSSNLPGLKHAIDFSSPKIRHGLSPFGAAGAEWTRTALSRQFLRAIAKPVGNPGENVIAILLGAKEHLVALQSAYVEQTDV